MKWVPLPMYRNNRRDVWPGLISIARSWGRVAGIYVVGWFFAKPKRHNGSLSTDVGENWVETIVLLVVAVSVLHALRSEGIEIMTLFSLLFNQRRWGLVDIFIVTGFVSGNSTMVPRLFLLHGTSELHELCGNLVEKVACCTRSCTVALSLDS